MDLRLIHGSLAHSCQHPEQQLNRLAILQGSELLQTD